MSISAISALGAGPGASPSLASPGSAQSPAQRISALAAQQAAIDAQIASTRADKKLTCSEIDSKVGSLKVQRAQIDAQLQRIESQQRQPADGSASATAPSAAAPSAAAPSATAPRLTSVPHGADARPAVDAQPPAPNLELGSSPGYRSQIHVIA